LVTAIYALSPAAVALLARGASLLKVQLSLEQQAQIDDLLVQLQTLDSSIDLMDDTLDSSFSLYKEKQAQTTSLLERKKTLASTTINKKKDQATTLITEATALITETAKHTQKRWQKITRGVTDLKPRSVQTIHFDLIKYDHRYLNGTGLQICHAANDFLPVLAPPLKGLTAWWGEWWESGVSEGADMDVERKPRISSNTTKCQHCQQKPHSKTTQQCRHLRSSPIFIRPPACIQRQSPDPKRKTAFPIHRQAVDELESSAKNPDEEARSIKTVSARVGGEGSEGASERGGERGGEAAKGGAIDTVIGNIGERSRGDLGEGAEDMEDSDAAGTTATGGGGGDFDACVEFEQKACWNCHARFYVHRPGAGATEEPRHDSKKMFHFNDEASTCIDGAHFCSGDCLWSWYFSQAAGTGPS
jgi:hypothetical protein